LGISIDRIKVNRGGPLHEDFILEPGDLNLIYGHNETGKTYVVESIINLLFETGRGSSVSWDLRGWDLTGRIVVSGLQVGKVTFTEASKKLDEYWRDEAGLPRDLSRLLVVKAGETRLNQENDGVGRDILKDYLSGEGMLDRIASGISATLKKATLANGQITGSNMGELKARDQLSKQLEKLDSLLKDVEEGYASSEVYSLRHRQEALETELEMLGKAKRYHAARLREKLEAKQLEAAKFPSEEELTKLESDISVYESDKSKGEAKRATLTELHGASEDYRWTEKALTVYQEIMGSQAGTALKLVYIYLALAFLAGAGTVVSGLLGHSILLIVCAIALMVFLVLTCNGIRRVLATAGYSRELADLKTEYKNRHGSELTDLAALKEKAEKLKEDHIRAGDLRKELDEVLLPDIQIRKNSINVTLKQLRETEVPPQEWRDAISEVRNNIRTLQTGIRSLETDLASLDVQEEEYLDQDPGAEWNRAHHNTRMTELDKTEQTLNQEIQKLDSLKTRIAQETGSESTDWEELINTLRDRRDKTAQECIEKTAEILAKIQVNAAIQEFREEENARIGDGLQREELTKPLHALTERYTRIRHDEKLGLVLATDEDQEFPLAAISTGAQEQAFLALRLGFASIAMEGETAFLILDDAFQHSDWIRRENLIVQILKLVEAKWQVFYFTMDDHIKDLFHVAGERVGDGFRSIELS
jgi:uncharacterized protein YhaN